MVEFNSLYINPECNNLIIDVSVLNKPYYNDIYIDSIVIDTQDTFIASGPSSYPVYLHTFNDNEKRVSLNISEGDFLNLKGAFNDTLFFIYVILKGTPSPDTPCGEDNSVCVRAVANMFNYYQKAMYYVKEIENTCLIPKKFIDCLLQFKALELSLKTGNYPLAIKYWNKFFKDNYKLYGSNFKSLNCGCI